MPIEPTLCVTESSGCDVPGERGALRWQQERDTLARERLREHMLTRFERRGDAGWVRDRVALMRALAVSASSPATPPQSGRGRDARDRGGPATTLGARGRVPRPLETPAALGDERSGPRAPPPRTERCARSGLEAKGGGNVTRGKPRAGEAREEARRIGARREQARAERQLSWGAEVRLADGTGAFVAAVDRGR